MESALFLRILRMIHFDLAALFMVCKRNGMQDMQCTIVPGTVLARFFCFIFYGCIITRMQCRDSE